MIEVFHAQADRLTADDWVRPNPDSVARRWQEGVYQKVAEVDSDDLEDAWRRTNSVDKSWTKRGDVTPLVSPCRSSMVGDVFLLNGEAFYVDSVGFTPVDLPKQEAATPGR